MAGVRSPSAAPQSSVCHILLVSIHQIANLVKLRSLRGFAVPKLIIALLRGRFQESSLVYKVYCVEIDRSGISELMWTVTPEAQQVSVPSLTVSWDSPQG